MSEAQHPASQRDQRAARLARERVDQILDAAAALFGSKGFHRTTTRDIAQQAGVSEGTLYNYFSSKDEILIGIVTRIGKTQSVDDDLDRSLATPPADILHRLLEDRQRFIGDNRQGLQAVLSEILVDPNLRDVYYRDLMKPFLDKLEDHLQKRADQGDILTTNPAVTARLLVAMVTGLFVLGVLGDEITNTQWNILDDSIVDLFFKGIQA
jgi:AcrR family transcriptional regulator